MKPVSVVIASVVTQLAVVVVAHTGAGTPVDRVVDQLVTGLGAHGTFVDGMLTVPERSATRASVSEPSGLLALALVMVTLGLGLLMRLAHEVRVLVWQCAQYRIDLGRVRRWLTTYRTQAR
jgi:hypothetical protein